MQVKYLSEYEVSEYSHLKICLGCLTSVPNIIKGCGGGGKERNIIKNKIRNGDTLT